MIKLSAFADEAGKSLAAQIAALKRHGISLIELRTVGDKNVKDLTVEEAQEIAAQLRENGIALSALGSPMGKVSITVDFDAYLGEVRHMLELARILGTDRIRMFSFFDAYDCPEAVFARLHEMVRLAKEYGITLCHENEKKVFGDTCARVLALRENVPGLGLVYDPANFLQVGESPAQTLPALHSLCTYFHIKDVIAATGELVPAGQGDGQIGELIDRINGDAVLTLEPHLKIFEGYAAIDGEPMKNKLHFESADAAFDAAVVALKGLLLQHGYREIKGGFIK